MESWEFVLAVVALNLVLSLLHKGLEALKDRTESKLDDRAFEIVRLAQELLEWVMANRRCK